MCGRFNLTINARGETLTSSPMFRDALATGPLPHPSDRVLRVARDGTERPTPMHIRSWENEGPELIAAVAPTVQVLE